MDGDLMREINLLPWRQQKRESEKKQFTTMLLSSGLTCVLMLVFIYYYACNLVKNQTARNQLLQHEMAIFDEQIKEIKALKLVRQGLISRMSLVRNLQLTRSLMVHLFDELIKVMPSGLYLTKLERQHDIVTLWGYSESNTHVSLLMNRMENNNWLQNPILTEIKKTKDKNLPADNAFKLSFILKSKYPVGD